MNGELLNTTCPHCNHVNIPRFKALTLAMSCQSCDTYFTTGKWSNVEVKYNLEQVSPIPLGSRCKLNDSMYELTGYTVKHVRKYGFSWREYVLYNPEKGLAYLSESNGNWNIVLPLKDNPRPPKALVDFNFDGNYYRLYQKFKPEVMHAKGEFFFDIFSVTKKTLNEEYISPPYLLSVETDEYGYRWFKGEYMSPTDVASSFGIPVEKLPPKEGRGYTQPFINSFTKESLVMLCLLLAALIFCTQIFLSKNAAEKTVFDESFNGNSLQEGQKMFVTPSFDLEGDSKSVTINIDAPLNNDWFFGDFVLVNDATESEYEFSQEIEYYSGYEGGESWAEGSTHGEAFLSKIPGGRYHIVIYPEFSFYNKQFSMRVVRDVPYASNMWITLLVVGIFPAFYFFRRHKIETDRWSDSDYSPYDE